MTSDSEDDYLSEKFLLEAVAAEAPKKPLTYAERRREAQRQSEVKNAQNRVKSRKEREAEAREQGLRQSLFERAKVEEQELGAKNKAVNMMLRMGFKPGEPLGHLGPSDPSTSAAGSSDAPASAVEIREPLTSTIIDAANGQSSELKHRTTPLPVDIWAGKKGVGLGKRAPSPGVMERASKAARIDEETKRETFLGRTREVFEERQVLGRLRAASRTLITLDEKAGVEFNILSLNPEEPDTIPSEILKVLSTALDDDDVPATLVGLGAQDSESERLRKQMEMDALQPLKSLSPDGDSDGDNSSEHPKKNAPLPWSLSEEALEEAREFLRMGARDRLQRVLHYLRERYYYCFWCGTQYNDKTDLDGNCPGEDEEAHD